MCHQDGDAVERRQVAAERPAYVAARLGIQPQFELLAPLSAGVMVFPMALEDSVLYIIVSDNADDAKVDFRDKSTGVQVMLSLPAEHAALTLIGRKQKAVIATYEPVH